MGGIEIIKILSYYLNIKNLVLQPMHNQKELRLFLINNGYNIKKDEILFDKGKYYTFLVCNKLKNEYNYSDFELKFGRISKNTYYINFLNSEKNRFKKIYDKSKSQESLFVLQNIEKVLKYIDKGEIL